MSSVGDRHVDRSLTICTRACPEFPNAANLRRAQGIFGSENYAAGGDTITPHPQSIRSMRASCRTIGRIGRNGRCSRSGFVLALSLRAGIVRRRRATLGRLL
jgi:hypothetical protein